MNLIKMKQFYYDRLVATLFTLILLSVCSSFAKVLDFGSKLPEFIEKHPDKNWLVKFYAPWCHHCKQLEPTFINLAETIYNRHDNLIVGKVDCTSSGSTCEKYGIQSYPTIIYLNQNTRITYKGDRSLESLISFSERLIGPDVRAIDDCIQLDAIIERHGLVVLLNEKNITSDLYREFSALAKSLKSNYWFYHMKKTCKDFTDKDGLFILKRYLKRAIRFISQTQTNDFNQRAIIDWLVRESFPVYGSINSMNFDRTLASGKQLVIAVLDEYKPAKQFSKSSREFHKLFESFAKNNAQKDDQYLFVWSSDLELIQSIIMGQLIVPNVLLLNQNFSYHLLVKDLKDSNGVEQELSSKLNRHSIEKLFNMMKSNELSYQGGNTQLYQILRLIYSQYNKFSSMFSSNPLLASILIGLPSIILLFVIYTTCCYDETYEAGENEEENSDNDEQQLINHIKQD